ncbi:hypothetical protein Tco_0218746 [Tanacetum coccineum]
MRAHNSKWFKEKMLLAQAQEVGVTLDEEQLALLANTGERVDSGPYAQALTTTSIFQTDDLDAFDSDCDEAPTTSAVFMENLSAYDSDVLSELPISKTVYEIPPVQPEPVQKDLPRQLPSTSMVKQKLLKAKSHLDNFNKVIKVRTKVTRKNEGTWGFEHIRGAFEKDVIPFFKSLRESFKNFELGLYREVYDMKAIFQQMETEVKQCSVDRKYFEIEKKELLIKNDRLLEQIISQDVVCTAMHSYDDL